MTTTRRGWAMMTSLVVTMGAAAGIAGCAAPDESATTSEVAEMNAGGEGITKVLPAADYETAFELTGTVRGEGGKAVLAFVNRSIAEAPPVIRSVPVDKAGLGSFREYVALSTMRTPRYASPGDCITVANVGSEDIPPEDARKKQPFGVFLYVTTDAFTYVPTPDFVHDNQKIYPTLEACEADPMRAAVNDGKTERLIEVTSPAENGSRVAVRGFAYYPHGGDATILVRNLSHPDANGPNGFVGRKQLHRRFNPFKLSYGVWGVDTEITWESPSDDTNGHRQQNGDCFVVVRAAVENFAENEGVLGAFKWCHADEGDASSCKGGIRVFPSAERCLSAE